MNNPIATNVITLGLKASQVVKRARSRISRAADIAVKFVLEKAGIIVEPDHKFWLDQIDTKMSVVEACGRVIGYVDAIVGDSIKVAAPSGQIRLIPLDWVERVGSSVYLTSDCEESHSRGVEWRNV